MSNCTGSYFIKKLDDIIGELPEGEEKRFLILRYRRLVSKLDESAKRSAFLYHLLSTFTTLGSIVVPSLISVQEKDSTDAIYWSVWSISVGVSISNALVKLFLFDKTYITRNIRLNQFKSEGAQYFSRVGDYESEHDEERFRRFVSNIETLRRNQIQEEYTNEHDLTPSESTIL